MTEEMLKHLAAQTLHEIGLARTHVARQGHDVEEAAELHLQIISVLGRPELLLPKIATWRLCWIRELADMMSEPETVLMDLWDRFDRPESLDEWLATPLSELEGRTPAAVLIEEEHGPERLMEVLFSEAREAIQKIKSVIEMGSPCDTVDEVYARLADWPRADLPTRLALPTCGDLEIENVTEWGDPVPCAFRAVLYRHDREIASWDLGRGIRAREMVT